MFSDRFEVLSYIVRAGAQISVSWGGQDIDAQGIIECKGKEATIIFYFVENPSQFTPVVNDNKKTAVSFHTFAHMPVFIDLLRNEKPIFGYINSRFPTATMISTSLEPVGEGE